MLRANVDVDLTKDLGPRVTTGVRRQLRAAADSGFAVGFDEAPSGATNTLKHSFFEPEWRNGRLVWGNAAPHSLFVEEDTRPHWIPTDAMPEVEKWARRVLGDESAAWAVRHKIAQEGTEGQHFMQAGFEEMERFIKRNGLGEGINAELER